ncbi:SRPBCC domain-containing protein [Streptomyces sp. NPDC004629]|uniref:SRPBCC domain-containing protein n=1 Tax=Streptomyces sp. NPDC004629 TaxID=3364705 RepID=UPI0036B4119E
MRLQNKLSIPASTEEAWRILLDIERVTPCVPGATLTSRSGDSYHGSIKVKLGPIGLTYRGSVRFLSLSETDRTVVLEAGGREARGNGTATARVTCRLVGSGDASTDVFMDTDLAITGKPAQFGRGALGEVAGTLIGQFAENLARELTGTSPTHPAPTGLRPAGSPSTGPVLQDLTSAGPTSAGSSPAGLRPAGSPSTGQVSQDLTSAESASAGSSPAGLRPAGSASTGPVLQDPTSAESASAGSSPAGLRRTGSASTGQVSQDLTSAESASAGSSPAGLRRTGSASTGPVLQDLTSAESASAGSSPAGLRPAGSASTGPVLQDLTSAESASAGSSPADLRPAGSPSTGRTSQDPTSAEPTSAEPTSAEPVPAESTSAGSPPVGLPSGAPASHDSPSVGPPPANPPSGQASRGCPADGALPLRTADVGRDEPGRVAPRRTAEPIDLIDALGTGAAKRLAAPATALAALLIIALVRRGRRRDDR